jgi:hypothetical protein
MTISTSKCGIGFESGLYRKWVMKMYEYIHDLDSRIGGTDALFLAHFGAPPVFGAKEFDRVSRKSLYCNDLSKKQK